MPDRDSVIDDLNVAKLILCDPQMLTPEMCIRIGRAITSAIALLKEQEHKDKMFHALEDDWKRLKELLKEQEAEISKISSAYLDLVGKAKKQPEIVRCKDCKHRDPEDKKCDCGHAIQWQLPRPDDWFCADGERK